MSGFKFQRAVRTKARLRLALCGPAGSGKTYTALRIGTEIGERVAVIDTEHSASKYAPGGRSGYGFDFDVLQMEPPYTPARFVGAIEAAVEAGYDLLIVDSLSHAWAGEGGALEMVDEIASKSRSKNSFGAWRTVTPEHNALVTALVRCPAHVIVTMRTKTVFLQQEVDAGGGKKRTEIVRAGLAPVQRDGLEYEFDVVGDMDHENTLRVTKTRCPELTGGVFHKPGSALADTLKVWLDDEVTWDRAAEHLRNLDLEPDQVVRFVVEKLGKDDPRGFGPGQLWSLVDYMRTHKADFAAWSGQSGSADDEEGAA